jgi:hypothetical protein
MKKIFVTILMAYFTFAGRENTWAQISIGGNPMSWVVNKENDLNGIKFSFPSPDFDALEKEDLEDEKRGVPPRFGFLHRTTINLLAAQNQVFKSNDWNMWRVEFVCPKALSINFIFDKFWLPEGGKLFIYSKDRKHLIGAFTNQNNKGTLNEIRGFATGLVYGENVVMEYEEPIHKKEFAIINISGVVHGYRKIRVPNENKSASSFGQSGSCQVNVNCPDGSNWQNEKRGIAMILVGGNRWCSGSLINNTLNNGDLLFLTANHCLDGRSATSNPNLTDYSFWWDYEAPLCGNPSSEPSPKITNGALILANKFNPDFGLLRLTESPLNINPPVNVFFNGWDRTSTPGSGGAGIHHPSGDIKKISIFQMSPVSNHSCVNSTRPNTWSVVFNHGNNFYSSTEGGSSGSPLFNNSKKIIGQLWSGFDINNCVYGPECVAPNRDYSYYGQLHVSWTGGGANTNRLSNWLDPNNSGATSLDGGYFNNCPQNVFVSNPINSFGEFQASNKVTASSTIASGANVSMKAGNSIEFAVGFGASTGSNVAATIGVCTPKMIPPPVRQVVDNQQMVSLETEESKFMVFPNPSNGKVIISLNLTDADNIVYRITNLMGQEIFSIERSYSESGLQNVEANLESFSSGVYLVAAKGKDFHFYKRVIKQ